VVVSVDVGGGAVGVHLCQSVHALEAQAPPGHSRTLGDDVDLCSLVAAASFCFMQGYPRSASKLTLV
jgi:hypothetical protein